MRTACTDKHETKWTNVIDINHPAARYIIVVDPLNNPILDIKSYNILTKEAVVYVRDPNDSKKILLKDNEPVLETMKLPYSRLVFIDMGDGVRKSQYSEEELEGLHSIDK